MNLTVHIQGTICLAPRHKKGISPASFTPFPGKSKRIKLGSASETIIELSGLMNDVARSGEILSRHPEESQVNAEARSDKTHMLREEKN